MENKLIPEMVPKPLHDISAAKLFKGRVVWTKKIRFHAPERAGNRCEICNEQPEGSLICHEKWQYDDTLFIATLIGFEIHCRDCDRVTHIGHFSTVLAPQIGLSTP